MLALKRLNPAPRLRRLPRLAIDLLLPPTCPGCGKAVADGTALCARCWSTVRFIEPPLCAIYGTPFTQDLGDGIVSAEALADPPPFRRARSAVVYGDVARRLVHQLKYHAAYFESDDGQVVMSIPDTDADSVLPLVRWLGEEAEILEPRSLREKLRSELDAIRLAYA